MRMKRVVWVAVLVLALVMVLSTAVGCRGIQVNAEWSDQIDRDAARLRAVAKDARAGRYQSGDMVDFLEIYADKWALLKAAKDGAEPPPVATTLPAL